MAFKLTYKPFGERAVLIEWPTEINEAILADIISFKENIIKSNIKSLVELNSSYNSLLIIYDYFIKNFTNEISIIDKIYRTKYVQDKSDAFLWKIPVCYDELFGLDLEWISTEKKIQKTELIKRHSEAIYTVYFIGFLPGFLYLGGLDKSLEIPRKSTPRLHVEKGAVAIGGNQTGVYPNASPGGWNIIGNSPVNFFDVSKEPPCFAKAGDIIQFYPITLNEHQSIKALVDMDMYQIESEVWDG